MESLLRTAAGFVGGSSSSPIHSKFITEDRPRFRAGLWKVYNATRRSAGSSGTGSQQYPHTRDSTQSQSAQPTSMLATYNQHCSVWQFDRAEFEKECSVSSWNGGGSQIRKTQMDLILEMLKKEATTLARLRHPSLLQLIEPIEETRAGLAFVTEFVTASLRSVSPEPDELEFQKGLSQTVKALLFLHHSANLVHGNLTPDAILINEKGDWKLGGLGFAFSLRANDGHVLTSGELKALWVYPEADRRLPDGCLRDLDYMAPEYALDESIRHANDLYALGCLVHYGKLKRPPFENRGVLSTFKQNLERLPPNFSPMIPEPLQDLLTRLLTRTPESRLSLQAFEGHRYFDNVLVSTLRFLEAFAEKKKEQRIVFLKGLPTVLSKFPERLIKSKLLPTLLEQSTDTSVLALILPNIFILVRDHISPQEFEKIVLPKLSRYFMLKDPPQVVRCLLQKENLAILKQKTSATSFRQQVMPLVYSALTVDGPVELQEAALRIIPSLIQEEAIDYTTVKAQLFPVVASLFSLTTLLSVKVNTLVCFHSIALSLDKYTLTDSMLPLLKAVRTKEPSVTIAILAVYEQIGRKVDRETIATQILPALWTMAVGPQLSEAQFMRFVGAIKELGTKVEQAQLHYLANARLERDSAPSLDRPHAQSGHISDTAEIGFAEIDFESLVQGSIPNGQMSILNDPFETVPDQPKANEVASFVPLQPSTPAVHVSSRFAPTTANNHTRQAQSGARAPLNANAFETASTAQDSSMTHFVRQQAFGNHAQSMKLPSLNELASSRSATVQTHPNTSQPKPSNAGLSSQNSWKPLMPTNPSNQASVRQDDNSLI